MKKLGKPLPKITDDFIPSPPDKARLDLLINTWNANCPPFYIGILEAGHIKDKKSKSKFAFDPNRGIYILRATGRVITQKELTKAFADYMDKVSKK